jgi:hypothetical protein
LKEKIEKKKQNFNKRNKDEIRNEFDMFVRAKMLGRDANHVQSAWT